MLSYYPALPLISLPPVLIRYFQRATEVLSYHNDSVPQALADLFPSIGLDTARFSTKSMLGSKKHIILNYDHFIIRRITLISLQTPGVIQEEGGASLRSMLGRMDSIHLIQNIGTRIRHRVFWLRRYNSFFFLFCLF